MSEKKESINEIEIDGEPKENPQQVNNISKRFDVLHEGRVDHYYIKNSDKEAFEDKGKKLVAKLTSKDVSKAIVELAENKGWEGLKVKGKENFRREVWIEAQKKGLQVTGYKPTKLEQQRYQINQVERESSEKPKVEKSGKQESATSEKARALTTAVKSLPRVKAIEKHPELAEYYDVEQAAKSLADRRIGDPDSKDKYLNAIRERSIDELSKGHSLPKIQKQQQLDVTLEKEAER